MNAINPGKAPVRKNGRDYLLIRDYQQKAGVVWKFNIVQLITKYKISSARIFGILEKNSIPKRGNAPLNNLKK